MRFYRVEMTTLADGNEGFEFFTSKREAEAKAAWFVRESDDSDEPEATVTVVDVQPTRRGIRAALNCYGGHPDNG